MHRDILIVSMTWNPQVQSRNKVSIQLLQHSTSKAGAFSNEGWSWVRIVTDEVVEDVSTPERILISTWCPWSLNRVCARCWKRQTDRQKVDTADRDENLRIRWLGTWIQSILKTGVGAPSVHDVVGEDFSMLPFPAFFERRKNKGGTIWFIHKITHPPSLLEQKKNKRATIWFLKKYKQ